MEKAFTRNAAEARQIFEAAQAAGVAAMEAMWTRFLPSTDIVRQLLADGALGDLETLFADHGQWFADDPGFRLFDPAKAGGAMLDLGSTPSRSATSSSAPRAGSRQRAPPPSPASTARSPACSAATPGTRWRTA
ncbi:Gfo/Idh/MocA family protein [Tessaracoccus coleopterorum]|uniref:Gfo/Idh/MocA family protein n=1 Tax=Tessaracoccus coleopterorum TaxID=2714950 RepID=UPI001E499C02|nr:hypothetical protein [Tessaracoccus coleopterorum]